MNSKIVKKPIGAGLQAKNWAGGLSGDFGNERFSRLSPLRRIPILRDDDVTLADSSVICQYLEDRHPLPRLYPEDIVARAEARWFEEYADTRMGEVLIWGLFNQLAIGPAVWGRPPDRAIVDRIREVDLPLVLDYLEERLPASGFVLGELSIADISIACFFRNAQFVRYEVDAVRWPRTAGFVDRMLALEPFAALRKIEDPLLRVAPAAQRACLESLEEVGVALTADSFGTSSPRPGVMRI
jgi:glutathione S-transferase